MCVWVCLGAPPLAIRRGVARKYFGDLGPTLRAGDYDSSYGILGLIAPYYGCSYNRAGLLERVQGPQSHGRWVPLLSQSTTAVLASVLTAYFNTVAARISLSIHGSTERDCRPSGISLPLF